MTLPAHYKALLDRFTADLLPPVSIASTSLPDTTSLLDDPDASAGLTHSQLLKGKFKSLPDAQTDLSPFDSTLNGTRRARRPKASKRSQKVPPNASSKATRGGKNKTGGKTSRTPFATTLFSAPTPVIDLTDGRTEPLPPLPPPTPPKTALDVITERMDEDHKVIDEMLELAGTIVELVQPGTLAKHKSPKSDTTNDGRIPARDAQPGQDRKPSMTGGIPGGEVPSAPNFEELLAQFRGSSPPLAREGKPPTFEEFAARMEPIAAKYRPGFQRFYDSVRASNQGASTGVDQPSQAPLTSLAIRPGCSGKVVYAYVPDAVDNSEASSRYPVDAGDEQPTPLASPQTTPKAFKATPLPSSGTDAFNWTLRLSVPAYDLPESIKAEIKRLSRNGIRIPSFRVCWEEDMAENEVALTFKMSFGEGCRKVNRIMERYMPSSTTPAAPTVPYGHDDTQPVLNLEKRMEEITEKLKVACEHDRLMWTPARHFPDPPNSSEPGTSRGWKTGLEGCAL